MFKTRITELLGIKYPIIQGAMVWLGRAELAAAVSEAGGLGIITAECFDNAEELRQEIRKTRQMTNRPFAVNVTLLPSRRPIHPEELLTVAVEEGVKIIETSGRSPEPYLEFIRKEGVVHMHKVARLRDARKAEGLGVQAITIVGFEGGGHPGMEDITSLVRVPVTADALEVPVIATGGFGDGRGLVAALALGAEGITMGTRFLLCKECPMHDNIKEMYRQATEGDTMIIERSINNAARALRSPFTEKVLEMEQRGANIDELYPFLAGTRVREHYQTGEASDAVFLCGQVVGLANEILSAREIIAKTMREAAATAKRLRGLGLL
ncbi:MAG: nitronate monooxygenase [Chloroflexota bacterium]